LANQNLEQDQNVICRNINESEKRSIGAERDSMDRYSALFISNHIDEYFDGVVVGSSRFCVFIRLIKFPIEGVLLKRDLKITSKKRFHLNRNKMKQTVLGLAAGHSIRVKVVSALPFNGSINFSI
jgi:ribonuclease R